MLVETSGGRAKVLHAGTHRAAAQTAGIAFVRVEDAPASRSDADYNFISNEIYVGFETVAERERIRRFGVLPGSEQSCESR